MVATDLSELSTAALEHARAFQETFHSSIHLVHVVDTTRVAPEFPFDRDRKLRLEMQEEEARDMMGRLAREHIPAARDLLIAVAYGDPAKEIIRYAEANGIEMIVMATHGRTGLAHHIIGSVAEKVVRHSTVPVFTVRPVKFHDAVTHAHDAVAGH